MIKSENKNMASYAAETSASSLPKSLVLAGTAAATTTNEMKNGEKLNNVGQS